MASPLILPFPKFIRGNLEFDLKPHHIVLAKKNISTFGSTGLPWKPLHPETHFGLPIMLHVETDTPEHFKFKTRAHILRETTLTARYMGLRFLLDEITRKKLSVLVDRHGHSPGDYVRKYPRIPSQRTIYTFPTKATIISPQRIVMDVLDLSPTGILLSTDNQSAQDLRPGKQIDFILEPRGWFPTAVRLDGYICRVTDDLDADNGNVIRRIGIQLGQPDRKNKTAFLDLLKSILLKIQEDSKEK